MSKSHPTEVPPFRGGSPARERKNPVSSSASSQPMLSLDVGEPHRRYSVAPLDDAWSWIRIRLFIRSSVHSLVHSFVRSSVQPFIHF